MNINEVTGLPELPAGQWWRVERRFGKGKLSIMEKRVQRQSRGILANLAFYLGVTNGSWDKARNKFGKKETVDVSLYSKDIRGDVSNNWEFTPQTILATALDMKSTIEKLDKAAAEAQTENDKIAALLGDYPPKTLRAAKK